MEINGEIVGVWLNATADAVAIKLSDGTAVTFDARFRDDVLTIEADAITEPYWHAMNVVS